MEGRTFKVLGTLLYYFLDGIIGSAALYRFHEFDDVSLDLDVNNDFQIPGLNRLGICEEPMVMNEYYEMLLHIKCLFQFGSSQLDWQLKESLLHLLIVDLLLRNMETYMLNLMIVEEENQVY